MRSWERLEALAKEIAERDGIDHDAALLRAIEEHPGLYEEFGREMRGPVGR